MTTYRLPEVLGGGEHEAAADVSDYPKVGFNLSGLTERLWLYRSDLTEVVPPLPEEPPVGAYRVGGVLCMRVSSEPNRCWVYQTADELFDEKTFKAICSDHGRDIVRLVPEPVVEPVTLPWASQPYVPGIMRTTVHVGSDGVVDENSNGHTGVAVAMPPERAREKAGALNTAADAAERAS